MVNFYDKNFEKAYKSEFSNYIKPPKQAQFIKIILELAILDQQEEKYNIKNPTIMRIPDQTEPLDLDSFYTLIREKRTEQDKSKRPESQQNQKTYRAQLVKPHEAIHSLENVIKFKNENGNVVITHHHNNPILSQANKPSVVLLNNNNQTLQIPVQSRAMTQDELEELINWINSVTRQQQNKDTAQETKRDSKPAVREREATLERPKLKTKSEKQYKPAEKARKLAKEARVVDQRKDEEAKKVRHSFQQERRSLDKHADIRRRDQEKQDIKQEKTKKS